MTEGVTIRRGQWSEDAALIGRIRAAVFTAEQGISETLETDDTDADCEHFLALDHRGEVVGVARLLPNGQIGRMAVLAERRGFGIGTLLLEATLDAARARGDTEVFLNAQVQAVAFYSAAGFVDVGEVFEEAGIDHQRMELQLGIPFAPQPDAPREVIKAEASRLPYSGPPLSEHSPDLITMDDPARVPPQLVELSRLARREVLIFSPNLDHDLFDHGELADAVSLFVRRNVHARARILVHDIKRMVQEGHALLALARRLPSHVEIRLVHPDMRDREDSFVVADRTGLWTLPKARVYQGFMNFNDAPLARQYGDVMDRLWDRSISDPNLRQMSL